jgi:hypothetical protein
MKTLRTYAWPGVCESWAPNIKGPQVGFDKVALVLSYNNESLRGGTQ